MFYKLILKPLTANSISCQLYKRNSITWLDELYSEFTVTFEKGITTYKPIPPNKTFTWPSSIDESVRNNIKAYFDGLCGEESFVWMSNS